MKIKALIVFFILVIGLVSCTHSETDKIIFSHTDENYGDTGGLGLPVDINNQTVEIMAVTEVDELSDSLVIKELSKRTGLDINVISILPSMADRQLQLYLATNELPDIMCGGLQVNEINRLGKSGTFAPINRYITELPNFKRKFIEDYELNSLINKYTAGDGNLYFFPRADCQKEITHSFLFRKDIFEKNSLETWKTTDEFYLVLKRLKELYPDSAPYISHDGEKILDKWAPSFGFEFPGMYYSSQTGKWQYSATHPGFIKMLDYFKKLYDEELIDRDFFNDTSYIWDWKITGENGFVTYGELTALNKAFGPEADEKHFLALAPAPDGSYRVYKNDTIGIGPAVANNKNTLLSLKLLDYLSSPSGIELSTLGTVNVTYEYLENGEADYISFSKNKSVNIKEMEEKFGLFIPGLFLSVDKKSPWLKYKGEELSAVSFLNEGDYITERKSEISLKDEEREKANQLITALDLKSIQFAENYILGTGNTDYREWMEEIKKQGADELYNIYND
ncbi:MAG: extracellular solute-binding protein [Ruminococcaceae bacterium]|nr:extracellular solute-binding protein [Oscillospiraceae bacterium]